MGHNKNQMEWNKENTRASVRQMGITFEQWSELVVKHFAMADQTMSMRNFHNELKAIRHDS